MPTIYDMIDEIDHGKARQALEENFEQLVDAVETHQKGGSITLTITVKPEGKRRAVVGCEVKAKIPQEPIHPTAMWLGDGQLHRSDPLQQELPVRQLGKEKIHGQD